MRNKKMNTQKKHSSIPFYLKLRTKLIASFMIPVLCIIVLGVVSYKQASNAIIKNYENSANETIAMMNRYIKLAIDTVKFNYKPTLSDDELSKYFRGIMEDTDGRAYASSYKKTLARDVNSNTLLSNIYIISDEQISIVTGTPTTSKIYTAYTETPEGALVKDNPFAYYVFGNQCDADTYLGTDSTEYSLRLARHLTSGTAIMLIDFMPSMLTETLSSMDAGQGGYTALITQDGTEFFADGTSGKNALFGGTDFYQSIAGTEEAGMKYVTYNGADYLFLYSPLVEQAAMLCTLIPRSTVLAQADSIKTVAMVMVIFAVIIATLLGCLLSAHINGNIYRILKQLEEVADGDLTIQLHAKSKDEFALLADGVNSMAESMKHLITNVTLASNSLNDAATQVSSSSATFMQTSQDIQDAISEIDTGITQLDDNSANCLTQMDTLSGKISDVTNDTNSITALTESTSSSISAGISSMNVLTESAKKTSEITDSVIQAIEALSEKSRSIGQIVESINSIANETNLLSLNASIEAARAGEAGRGFAVVAEQIRQLADQSAASAKQIQLIINDITANTGEVVSIAKEAEATVEHQEKAVSQTTESFLTMDKQIHTLIDSIAAISENMRNMEAARSTTLNAIEGISTISAETAAGSANVRTTVTSQHDAISTLETASEILQDRAAELTELLRQFKI